MAEDSQSLGIACDGLGLNKQNFLDKLSELDLQTLTNAAAFEIFEYVKGVKGRPRFPWKLIRDKLCCVFNVSPDNMSETDIRNSLDQVKIEKAWLQKNSRKPELLENFLKESFSLPKPRRPKVVHELPVDAESPILPKRPKLFFEEVQDILATVKVIQQQNQKLREENDALKLTCMQQKAEIFHLKCDVQTLDKKRVSQKLKRQKHSIFLWKKKYFDLKRDARNVTLSKQKLSEARRENKVLQKRLKQIKTYNNARGKKHATKVEKKLTNKVADLQVFVSQKFSALKQCEGEVAFLEDQCEQLKESVDSSNVLNTRIDGKTYAPEIREFCYHLQDVGVSQQNVSRTLKLLIETATGKELCGPLPSCSTQNYLTKEMKSISRQQVAKAVSGVDNLTLKYDGTTKKVGHLLETELETQEGIFLTGLRQQVGGTALQYAVTITDSVNAIQSYLPDDNNLKTQITNTMTDRCKTNDAVDRKLEETFGHELNRFRCAMYPLDGMAKECEKVVKEFEERVDISSKKGNDKFPFQHRGESNTQALVRCTAKLFFDPQFNCDESLASYLKSNGSVPAEQSNRSVIYYRFVGNRFHIYFLCSGLLYHFKDSILQFFSAVSPPANVVQQSVRNALKVELLSIVLRALGIVGKVITGPWMRLLGLSPDILAMNMYYKEAQDNLAAWSTDASELVGPNPPSLFASVAVKNDVVLESLSRGEKDDRLIEVLQSLCKACLDVIERQLKSQLPGGILWEPSLELQRQAKSVSATNISGERNFATADRARNAAPGHIESKVMFKRNETGKFLTLLDRNEKLTVLKHAMKDARKIGKEEKERKLKLQEEIREKSRASRMKLQSKEDSDRDKMEQWFELAYAQGGVWLNREDVERHSRGLTAKKTKDLLKAQINIRNKVLKCHLGAEEKVLFTKSSADELREHAAKLTAVDPPPELCDLLDVIQNPRSLSGLYFVHLWLENDERVWYDGQFLDYLSTTNEFQVRYEKDPEDTYLTPDKVVVDIIRGDLEVHY